jgi:ABC-2 type transport system ATP-binding protein
MWEGWAGGIKERYFMVKYLRLSKELKEFPEFRRITPPLCISQVEHSFFFLEICMKRRDMMIKAKSLTKNFGEKCAVREVSFEADKGEILGFLGPNAAGKTTTMRILTGYFPPTSGTAEVAGYDILENPMEVKKRVGYLPENFPLYKDMTVREFLGFVAAIKGVPHVDRKKMVASAVERCGLNEEAGNFLGRLSKGYCQRVGIAQAIITDPDVLILDEPTVGLDPHQIVEIRDLIKSFAGRSTVILSSHILHEVSLTCHRVIIINHGDILTIDTPENLSRNLQKTEKVTLEIGGSRDEVTGLLKEIKGVLAVEAHDMIRESVYCFTVETDPDHDITKEIARRLVEAKHGLFEMKRQQLTLEDIFIKLVDRGGASN